MTSVNLNYFCGGGFVSQAMENVLGEVSLAVNHDGEAIAMHRRNHPNTHSMRSDVFDVELRDWLAGRQIGVGWFSPDCFAAGTLILTIDGYRPIEDLIEGDLVLTHKGRWRPVTATMKTFRNLVTVIGQGHPGLQTSAEHPIYARASMNRWNNAKRRYERHLHQPEWVKALDLDTKAYPSNKSGGGQHYWATPTKFQSANIPEIKGRGLKIDERLMWLAGRYVGDGWTRLGKGRAELVITCGRHEKDALRDALSAWPRSGNRSGFGELAWNERSTKTAYQFATSHKGLVEWLRSNFGHLAHSKSVPGWLFGSDRILRDAWLRGYLSADGWGANITGSEVREVVTVSKALAFSVRSLAESLGMGAHVYGPLDNSNTIEGRAVNSRPTWRVRWRKESQRPQNIRDDAHNWTRVQSTAQSENIIPMFNISVEEDETYIAESIVVHNCKHFSRAKGGQLRDQKVRGLAWVVCRVAGLPDAQRPRVIFVENVPEFRTWAPLTKAGRIDKRHIDGHGLGSHFRKWVGNLRALGYKVEWQIKKASDYGDPTIRKRLFVIARCDGEPIVWPAPTHGDPNAKHDDLFAPKRKLWRTAADIIDWSVPCPSIFERDRPLAEATCKRIATGLIKYVIDNADPFIVQVNHSEPGRFRGQPLDKPIGSVTQSNGRALVTPYISVMGYGERKGQKPRVRSMHDPLHTVPAGGNKAALIAPIIDRQFGTSRGADINTPIGSVMTQGAGKSALVSAFVAQHNTGVIGRDARAPLSTIVQRGTTQNPVTIKMERRQDHSDDVSAFLIEYYGNGKPRGIQSPIGSVTTHDRFALISAALQGWGIVDIGMRMLTNRELARAMSVQDDFDLCEDILTKTSITAKIGNGVPRLVVESLLRANAGMYAKNAIEVAA